MNTTAFSALSKLLRSAENAWAKRSAHPIRLKFSEKTFPEYLGLATFAEKKACNSSLRLAADQGAIHIEWMDRSGENNQIDRIELLDANRLSKFLGVLPRWEKIKVAEDALRPHIGDFPVLEGVLEKWRIGETVKTKGAEKIEPWLEAIQVVKHCRAAGFADVPVRRVSATIANDSKRLEALVSYLDILTANDISLPQRDKEEVFNELGLLKFPSTILVSGDLSALNNHGKKIEVVQPYIGLAPQSIDSWLVNQSTQVLLTVENLTTFHELATQNFERQVIVLYTAGMPPPSWKRVYSLLLAALPPHARVTHWGDIDAGGFRIADHLARVTAGIGRSLSLHNMWVEDSEMERIPVRDELSGNEVSQIERICSRWDWQRELEWVVKNRKAIEQEAVAIRWPLNVTQTLA